MRLLFTPLLFLFAISLNAQIGVQSTANFYRASDWFLEGVGEIEGEDFEVGSEIALNYWFRLPKQRVEFLPTVYYAAADFGLFQKLNEYGAQMKMNVYPFDFLGDCDCPTFGKQGPQLQKGFFLQFSGGYAIYDTTPSGSQTGGDSNASGFTYGGGLGLDIGVSNLITVTPLAGVRFGASSFRDVEITDVDGQETDSQYSKLTTFQVGILVSFRFDHKKY